MTISEKVFSDPSFYAHEGNDERPVFHEEIDENAKRIRRTVDRHGNSAWFYPTGRKGEFFVGWSAASGGAGGERAGCREDAERVAGEILRRLAS